ncbi:hypothetical protein JXA34_03740 [Patescibacteria group bacterium]|nr:hypothetical protein [Patescibacteria group bacterium]
MKNFGKMWINKYKTMRFVDKLVDLSTRIPTYIHILSTKTLYINNPFYVCGVKNNAAGTVKETYPRTDTFNLTDTTTKESLFHKYTTSTTTTTYYIYNKFYNSGDICIL